MGFRVKEEFEHLPGPLPQEYYRPESFFEAVMAGDFMAIFAGLGIVAAVAAVQATVKRFLGGKHD